MKRVASILLIAAVGLVAAGPVCAQSLGRQRPERPSRALFGSNASDKEPVLSVAGSVATGYDTNPSESGQDAGLIGNGVQNAGASMYTGLGGQLLYTRTAERLGLGASISSSGRYYPQIDRTFTTSHAGAFGAQVKFSDRTRLDASQSLTYQSARGFVPFSALSDPELGQISAPDLDFSSSTESYISYATGTNFTHQLSRRTTLTASYYRESADRGSRGTTFTTQSGSFRLTRVLTRELSLRLGYGLVDTNYQNGSDNYRVHNIDSGLVFARNLSLTRRTRLSFTSGATVLKENLNTRFEAIGTANLTHEIGRSWNASVLYNRNFGYSDALRAPYLADNLGVGIGGHFNRRVGFQSGVGASFGDLGTVSLDGTEAGDSGFNTWYANSTLQIALTRNLAITAAYTFYGYEVDRPIYLTPGFAPTLGRQSASVSLNVFKTLVEHRRRPDAAR